MKKVVLLIIIVAIIALVAVLLLVPQQPETPVNNSGEIVSDISSKYGIYSSHSEAQNGSVNIRADVPYFIEEDKEGELRLLGDLAEKTNKEIRDTVSTYSEEILLFQNGLSYNDKDNDITRNKQYLYTVDYDRYNNGNYISLVLNMNYNTGGLRSNTWKEQYNIDVVNNKRIKLADLFNTSNYKERIVREINAQAKSRYIQLINEDGVETIPSNQKFYIKDYKLIIYFESSAISKDAVEFEMPFTFDKITNKFNF